MGSQRPSLKKKSEKKLQWVKHATKFQTELICFERVLNIKIVFVVSLCKFLLFASPPHVLIVLGDLLGR
jgi:hypothetical protein